MGLIGKHHPEGDHGGELWLVSYADMMTLLLGFFVIIYSLSTPDEQKMQAVGKQLAEAFGGEQKKDETTTGAAQVGMQLEARHLRALQLLVAMLNLGDNLEDAVGKIERKAAEAKGMQAAKDAIMDDLKAKDDGTLTQLKMQTQSKLDSIDIALPDNMLFESGTADLTPRAKTGLRKIAVSLAKVKGLVGLEVSGHTDSQPPSRFSRYPSNWALSAARAGAVAEELIRDGIDPKGVIPRGMASLQPLFPERREDGSLISENLARNRRVQITVKKVRYGDGK
jgi:chemotaxis protein MotB